MSETTYYTPETVDDARRRLDGDGFRTVVAGGQTLMLLLRQGLLDADVLVDVGDIPALSGIETEDGTARIGAATTYRDLGSHDLADRIGMLGDACGVVGDRQIRGMGTIGGALGHADPAFDLIPTLCCLDAEIRVGSVEGERTVPISEFLVGHMTTDLRPDELIEGVQVGLEIDGSAYEKHAETENGWATVGVAAAVTLADGRFADVRIALAAVADTAVRSPAVEDSLVSEPVTDDAVAAASDAVVADIDPVDDLSGSATYTERLAPVVVERALERAVERAGGSL
ncbi:FAD binding domain-containing protein [Natronoarchaeum sp. GCM10025703]|uniref:FAD binding domain-containing protein n=1 Tax=unclassified Natronoarchaeum TaxID=2620183 RepID=UPI0036109C0A